ncbi:iron-containing alcohol dehydrogenase [Fodinicurvata halophila]|uniref:Iron-containing alcohol dehydrogenase n=1 Tax=Fodinicurvata halophila TaxID=1419723 RepID=A0ABV8UM63_9PROT
MTELSGNWSYPTTIWAGPGRIHELPQACRQLAITRPLLITDAGLKDSPIVQETLSIAESAGLPTGLFAEVKGNPIGENVDAGVRAYHEGEHDGIIAFGGGSGLDAAKAVALMVGQTRPIWDFEDVGDNWTRADAAAIAPVVAVPTTAGTGSEVGRASVITNEATHEKKIIFHPRMLPAVVIEDPGLTVGLPAKITAATGLDAFVHCFEAYCAPGFHPLADGFAIEGMRLIKEYLPRAYTNGEDIEARANMLAAASMGASAFQKGLGAVHAIAHPLGALYDTHHGLTNAILLPYVMQYNRPAIAERMDLVARVLDLPKGGFEGVLDWVLAFREQMNIPHTLSEIGVDADRSAEIGRMAIADPSAGGNPQNLTAETLERIFLSAQSGELREAV